MKRPPRSSAASIPHGSKAVLSDLEQMTPGTTTADDFVDLAETAEFKPEIQEGECSA